GGRESARQHPGAHHGDRHRDQPRQPAGRARARPGAAAAGLPGQPAADGTAAGAGALMDVTLEGVTVERGGRTVLDVSALAFLSGTTTAVFGPNGSGKTTLLRVVGGLDRPRRGVVRVGIEESRRP